MLSIILKAWNAEAWWSRMSRSCALQGCAELRSVLVRCGRDIAAFGAGCSGLKVKFDQLLDTTGKLWVN